MTPDKTEDEKDDDDKGDDNNSDDDNGDEEVAQAKGPRSKAGGITKKAPPAREIGKRKGDKRKYVPPPLI